MFRTWVQVKTFVFHKCQHASGLPTGDLKIAAVLKAQRFKKREPGLCSRNKAKAKVDFTDKT